MSNIIPINTPQSPLTMSSAEIADLLEVRHGNVKRTIERLAQRGVIDVTPMEEHQIETSHGRKHAQQIYRLQKRDSYVVVAQLSPEFTARIVDRWQELEAQTQPVVDVSSLSRLEIFEMALNAERERVALESQNQQLATQIAAAAPAVEFAAQVEAAPDAVTVAQAAKLLGTGQNRLMMFLRQQGWVTRRNEPYQQKITAGLMDVKLSHWEHPKKGLQESITAIITGKGLARLQQLWDAAQSHKLV